MINSDCLNIIIEYCDEYKLKSNILNNYNFVNINDLILIIINNNEYKNKLEIQKNKYIYQSKVLNEMLNIIIILDIKKIITYGYQLNYYSWQKKRYIMKKKIINMHLNRLFAGDKCKLLQSRLSLKYIIQNINFTYLKLPLIMRMSFKTHPKFIYYEY